MRKILLFVPILTMAFLIGCSGKDVSSLKKEGPSIRGVVSEIDDDTFTIDSRDRVKQGKIIVTKRVEIKKGEINFERGDTITIYYDKIEGNRPAMINKVYALELNKKAEKDLQLNPVENDEEEKLGYDDIDYYEMPLLTIVKDEEAKKVSKNNSALIHDILHSIPWENGIIEDHEEEYKIMDDVTLIATFDSSSKTLNDIQNEVSVKLHPEIAKTLLKGLNDEF